MRRKRKILIDQLNEKLRPFYKTRMVAVPQRGWVNTIRTTLNMTMAQLGEKIGITRQGVRSIEESEARGSITLNSLKEVAQSLDMRLVYALVPKNGTIDDLIETKATTLAKKIVQRTHQTMKLEDQEVSYKKIEKNIKELVNELKDEMRKSLWD